VSRITQAEDLLAIESSLHDEATSNVAQVKEFGAAFLLDVQSMRATFEFPAPRFDELAIGIEDDNRVRALTRFTYGVMDVDMALGVMHDAMSVSVLNRRWQRAPVVIDLIRVLTSAHNGTL